MLLRYARIKYAQRIFTTLPKNMPNINTIGITKAQNNIN